ncbi:hypothetical protein DFH27DRAFT_523269 [Peziza echinospora]|nr:hypothetical protein DFH27DRAFT_523269 [Peziza echinospora]
MSAPPPSNLPEPVKSDQASRSPTPGYASADEEHFSDASEKMESAENQHTSTISELKADTSLEADTVSGGNDGPPETLASPIASGTAIDSDDTKTLSPPEDEVDREINSVAKPDATEEGHAQASVLDSAPPAKELDKEGEDAVKESEKESGSGSESIGSIDSTQPSEIKLNAGTNTSLDTSTPVLVETTEKSDFIEDAGAESQVVESHFQSTIPDDFGPSEGDAVEEEDQDDGFGDDFDDFGEAVEGGDDDGFDDFEAFEDGTGMGFESIPQPVAAPPPPPPPPTLPFLPVPVIDFDSYEDENEVRGTVVEIVDKIYATENDRTLRKSPKRVGSGTFLTERSESLWNQLVAPPPLQPPDWKRSRIRRLFLVSLGVPVDLDEILPASKQKKLVLPSTRSRPAQLAQSESAPGSRRSSTDSTTGGRRSTRSKSRSRADTTPSSSSQRSSKIDKSPQIPQFDEPAARILCSTSDMVLQNMSEAELREHMRSLQALTSTASELLTYWLKKRDGAMSDKETFETVIESLVGYARKTRQSGR